jgi:predicted RNA-binding protein YlxR (DUF448 family)
VGCRRVAGQDELRRVALDPSGEVAFGRNTAGRGAWLCAGSVGCLEKALLKGSLARALGTKIDVGATDRLRAEYEQH